MSYVTIIRTKPRALRKMKNLMPFLSGVCFWRPCLAIFLVWYWTNMETDSELIFIFKVDLINLTRIHPKSTNRTDKHKFINEYWASTHGLLSKSYSTGNWHLLHCCWSAWTISD